MIVFPFCFVRDEIEQVFPVLHRAGRVQRFLYFSLFCSFQLGVQ